MAGQIFFQTLLQTKSVNAQIQFSAVKVWDRYCDKSSLLKINNIVVSHTKEEVVDAISQPVELVLTRWGH